MKYIDRVKNGENLELPRSENSSKQIPKKWREGVEELEGSSSITFLPRFWRDLSVFRIDLRGGREREPERKRRLLWEELRREKEWRGKERKRGGANGRTVCPKPV
jgi:hypothetical protein